MKVEEAKYAIRDLVEAAKAIDVDVECYCHECPSSRRPCGVCDLKTAMSKLRKALL